MNKTGSPSILKHIRDIILLPFTMSVIVPYLCHKGSKEIFQDHIAFQLTGILVFIIGLSLFAWTVYLFRSFGKGTLAPWTPTQRLVVKGPYRYCRNPMISGVFFMQLGESLYFNSLNILSLAGIFFLVNTIYFILKEEPDLQKRFGEDYVVYKRNVPRWIPRIRPFEIAT